MTTITHALSAGAPMLRIGGVNRDAFRAGMMVLTGYLFIGLPVQVGALAELGITAEESSSWFFVTWMTTGLISIVLALVTRQPVALNLSIPAMIFLLGAAQGYSLPQIIGANLVAGVLAIVISSLGLIQAFTRLVPPQIALGVITGNILALVVRAFNIGISDIYVAGPVAAGYLIARVLRQGHLSSLMVAIGAGTIALLTGGTEFESVQATTLPTLKFAMVEFNVSAIVALGLPVLVLTAGIANVQAIAVLRSEGYNINANKMGLVGGVASVINAAFGGHAASLGGSAIVLAAGPSAGPKESRFWSILFPSVIAAIVAMFAVFVIGIVQQLPSSFTLVIGSLAMIPALKAMGTKAVNGPMWAGGITAIVVAALPFQLFGLSMPFWALFAGTLMTTVVGPCMSWQRRRPFNGIKSCDFETTSA